MCKQGAARLMLGCALFVAGAVAMESRQRGSLTFSRQGQAFVPVAARFFSTKSRGRCSSRHMPTCALSSEQRSKLFVSWFADRKNEVLEPMYSFHGGGPSTKQTFVVSAAIADSIERKLTKWNKKLCKSSPVKGRMGPRYKMVPVLQQSNE